MNEQETKWRAESPDLAKKLDQFLSGKAPQIDYSAINPGTDAATRSASAAVLGVFAEKVGNMIVASADLSNSDKTDGFLKKTKAFTKGDFTGQFFQAGVSEFTMACVMNGMALHGGVIPACGTFFVFSDYMKPAVRLSALMRLHVVYIWTHDSFRVGEDGPTHQPVEHEAQIRLLEHLRNHSGERSMVVLRPADGPETVTAWKHAMEEERPVGLILSRQNIKDLPASSGKRAKEAEKLGKGAYVVADTAVPDVVLLASGSEVSTLNDAMGILAGKGVKARLVSIPSEGIFRDQPLGYQNEVLPEGVMRFGLTSGLPVTLAGLVGSNGRVHGLDHFGYSAPYKVLDEKFGFSGEQVAEEILDMLSR
jgi:Transketolase